MLFYLALGALACYVWDTLRAKEIATIASKRACISESVQFLDDTVVKQKIWLSRRAGSLPSLNREYSFEFSQSGFERSTGYISLVGKRVASIEIMGQRLYIH